MVSLILIYLLHRWTLFHFCHNEKRKILKENFSKWIPRICILFCHNSTPRSGLFNQKQVHCTLYTDSSFFSFIRSITANTWCWVLSEKKVNCLYVQCTNLFNRVPMKFLWYTYIENTFLLRCVAEHSVHCKCRIM